MSAASCRVWDSTAFRRSLPWRVVCAALHQDADIWLAPGIEAQHEWPREARHRALPEKRGSQSDANGAVWFSW
jgi:hypothetical protein